MDHAGNFGTILEMLEKVLMSPNETYPIIEVGTREGGSTLCFLEMLNLHNKKNWLYTIDPYGAIPYSGGEEYHDSPYNNQKYRIAMKNISHFALENNLNHHHFKCTSEDFANFIYPNFKQYENTQANKLSKFSFVFLDGNHHPDVVLFELKFFLPLLSDKGCVVIDDTFQRKRVFDVFIGEQYGKQFGYVYEHRRDRTIVVHRKSASFFGIS